MTSKPHPGKSSQTPADSPVRSPLYLEDLRIGQIFLTGQYALDAEQIKHFAKMFDPQPFHLDEQAAAQSLFGGLAASGWHVAALTMRLLVTSGLPIAGGLIGAGAEISWPRPTRQGDVLVARGEVIDWRVSKSKPDRGIATIRVETKNQRGEILQIMTAKLIVFRRPIPAG